MLTLLIAFVTTLAASAADTFSYPMPLDPQRLDWAVRHDYRYDSQLLFNIMEGLVEIGPDGSPVPALAERWDTSPDGRTYTFHLRHGVKWSDGVPLKARDFVSGWRRVLDPKSASGYDFYLYDLANAEAYHKGLIKDFSQVGVKALDDSRLQIRLAAPTPQFVNKLYFYITFPQREDVVTKPRYDFNPLKLVTLGPYRITGWTKGKELLLTVNPDYYGAPPSVRQVRIRIEPDMGKVDQLAAEGKLNILLRPTTQQVVRHTVDSKVPWSLKQYDSLSTIYLGFNTRLSPVSNVAFRRAIAMALDRRNIAQKVASGMAPADALIPRSLPEYAPATLPIDVTEARTSLLAAGYNDPENLPRLKLLYETPDRKPIAEFVRDTLASNLGLKVELEGVSLAELTSRMRAGDFPLFLSSWVADYYGASSFFEMMLPESGFNLTGWKSAKYEELVQRAKTTTNEGERTGLYATAQQLMLRTDIAMVPMCHQKISVLVNDAVEHFELFPTLPYFYFKRIAMKR